MTALLIGYARVSTDAQDLTGTDRERPGLREAPAACRGGDTLVVTELDRPARSLPDARAIAEELTVRQVRLSLSGSVYDPHDPVGRLLIDVLAMVAESIADVIRLSTRARTPCGALLPKRTTPKPTSRLVSWRGPAALAPVNGCLRVVTTGGSTTTVTWMFAARPMDMRCGAIHSPARGQGEAHQGPTQVERPTAG